MYDKRGRDDFVQIDGIIEHGKELAFIIFKFILAILKNICQRKLFVWYHISTTFLLVEMYGCCRHFNYTINQ